MSIGVARTFHRLWLTEICSLKESRSPCQCHTISSVKWTLHVSSSQGSLFVPKACCFTADKSVDGVVASYCLIQAEAAVFIIAQTLPVIRVMFQSNMSSPTSHPVTSVAEPTYSRKGKGKGKAPAPELPTGAHEGVELVQLPTGKIVAASSEEGKAFKEFSGVSRPAETAESTSGQGGSREAGPSFEDEVHKAWADMGLSTRAWSKSPTPEPAQPRI